MSTILKEERGVSDQERMVHWSAFNARCSLAAARQKLLNAQKEFVKAKQILDDAINEMDREADTLEVLVTSIAQRSESADVSCIGRA